MSGVLTAKMAEQAVSLVMPVISMHMESGLFSRRHLHIVVADPLIVVGGPYDLKEWRSVGVLYEFSIGEPSEWEYDYRRIALSKTHLSWRYNKTTQIVQKRCPFLLESGDTDRWGSAVSDGLVVGVSGVQPYYDQMIAAWVLEACRALSIEAVETGKVPIGDNFLA